MTRTPLLRATRQAASLGLSAALSLTCGAVPSAFVPSAFVPSAFVPSAFVLSAFVLSAFAPSSAFAQTPAASKPHAPSAQTPPASSTAKPPSAPVPAANLIETDSDTPEQKLAKRRERLELAAKRLRERAAEVRQQAGHPDPNSKRPPPANPEQQAQKLEEQAQRMEDRAKSLTLEDVSERSSEAVRANRHRLRRAHINRRWGAATLRDPEAMTELRVHAERVAKLKRIQTVAREKNKEDPAIARARALLAREDDRHEQHMKAIQARVAPNAASNNSTATTAPEAK